MTAYLPAVLLAILNILLVWLLMALPIGQRRLAGQIKLTADADTIWEAVSPGRGSAVWNPAIVSSRRVRVKLISQKRD